MTIDSRQDCYFFLADGCTKGAMCSFRHNEVCKTNKVLCPDWSTTKICKTDNCDKLHSTFHVPNQPVAQASKAEIQCYWELNGGCLKPTCPFKHSMPKTSECIY
ncbi:hypothetical protein K502DRAFT_231970 [Neoconidiobolus thromboides FSU 785]|nr:hypothetical protein K502DRAFT_231970 [Neoconidiobolus thromboides FSU 785]